MSASAKDGNDFSAPYGLLVHAGNQDLSVPRVKALEVLLNYFEKPSSKTLTASFSFTDVKPETPGFDSISQGCLRHVFACDTPRFRPTFPLSLEEFTDWFFRLRYPGLSDPLSKLYPGINNASTRNWMEARRLNLLTGDVLTYKALQDFLFRYASSETNGGLPYDPLMAIDPSQIDAAHYHNLAEIQFIGQSIRQAIGPVPGKIFASPADKAFAQKLEQELLAFQALYDSLVQEPYLLTQRTDFVPEISELISRFGLQDVLASYSYNYSKNPGYRKYNLMTGIQKAHAKVLMPDEVLDYWKMISDKGLSDFRYGWVIVGGEEQWEFGGGICGSATLLFIPSWKAGLAVVERRNHSEFYSSLYPRENIGLDATVYRPHPNLKLKNTTSSPIVFDVIHDPKNQVVTVEVIGNSPYKSLTLEGPLFLKPRAVQWNRQFEAFDGTLTKETLDSRYNAIH